MQNGVGNSQRIINILNILLLNHTILNYLKLGKVVTLKLFEIIVSRNDNFFTLIINAARISAKNKVLDSVRTVAFETFKEKLS